ncbi:MAG: hypothetical protein ABSB13_03180 [Candidatus Binatus sp.]|jgi:hypothetical protein|uniref:hypothetical protein n=1 Tax=Candidatus Binatus sp. TaxID=2811406 RepID=UPI003D1483F6
MPSPERRRQALEALAALTVLALASAIIPNPTRAQDDKRCADLATFVETVAEARDAGMSKREYKQGFNLGLNSVMSGSQLNYGQRVGTREQMDALIERVWNKHGSSPEQLSEQANAWCEKWGIDLSDPFGDEIRRIRKGEGLPPEP